jgi:hypothetical protein
MEFAKNVLISVSRFARTAVFRFAFLRSDLSCHHIRINLSNQLVELRFAASGHAGLTLM